MSTELIVNDQYYSYTLAGAVKRIGELRRELNKIDKDDRDSMSHYLNDIYDLEYYIETYAKKYANYVTRKQLVKICMFKEIIFKVFDDLQEYNLRVYPEFEMDRTTYESNKNVITSIFEKLDYHTDEYNNYINSIGYKLDDPTQAFLIYDLINIIFEKS
jgi:hypothetical protein